MVSLQRRRAASALSTQPPSLRKVRDSILDHMPILPSSIRLLAILAVGCAQAAPVESGKFRLHKFEQAIGEESYEIGAEGDLLLLDAKFAFDDRGGKVSLTASLRAGKDGSPLRYEVKGATSRSSRIDSTVEVAGA